MTSDFLGYKVLYVYFTRPRIKIHEGVDCIHLRDVRAEKLIGKRYFHWFFQEESLIDLSDEELAILNSTLYKG